MRRRSWRLPPRLRPGNFLDFGHAQHIRAATRTDRIGRSMPLQLPFSNLVAVDFIRAVRQAQQPRHGRRRPPGSNRYWFPRPRSIEWSNR